MGHPLGRPGRIRGVENQTLHAAWSLSEEGWQLYPVYAVDDEGMCACPKGPACPDPGKHPTTPHGFNDASSDPERIADMFARWPGGNVGFKTGRASGTVIIDVDPRDSGMETLGRLQAEHGYLPPTRLHATGGGGFHYVLGYPEGVQELPSRTIGPGVEVKADGAGVVLPPSKHASGRKYEVLIDAPLAPLPSWVAELARELRVLAGGAEQPTESRFKLPEHIYKTASPRNRTLFEYGCSLRAHGWDHAAILTELRRVNAERCIPPMSDYEVEKIARSAARYQPGNALTVSPEVLADVAYLEERAKHRAKKGLGAHSRWAVYRALLDCAKRHGYLHKGRDVGVRISVRRLALDAGLGKTATQDAVGELDAAGLVYRVSRGHGPVPGTPSLTAIKTMLRRIEASGKPGRILYIADHDPAGQAMPISVARHCQFACWELEQLADEEAPSIKVDNVAVTHEQVEQLGIPGIPIKETDARKARFELQHGEQSAVEVEALEAIHPGELARILCERIEELRDDDLGSQVELAREEAEDMVTEALNEIEEQHREALEDIARRAREIVERYEPLYEQIGSEVSERYGKLAARFQRHVAPLREEVEVIQDQVRQAVDDLDVDLPDLPEGEAYEDEDRVWLFDSERGFLEQTEHFREAQGRE